MQAYLALHHQVDVCLDTFPYNGGTTTLHALWMGVPTLTLAGQYGSGPHGRLRFLGMLGWMRLSRTTQRDFVQQGLLLAGNDFLTLAESAQRAARTFCAVGARPASGDCRRSGTRPAHHVAALVRGLAGRII